MICGSELKISTIVDRKLYKLVTISDNSRVDRLTEKGGIKYEETFHRGSRSNSGS